MCNIHQTTVSVSSLDALCSPSFLGIKTGSLHNASGSSLGAQLHCTPALGFPLCLCLASIGLTLPTVLVFDKALQAFEGKV